MRQQLLYALIAFAAAVFLGTIVFYVVQSDTFAWERAHE